MVQANSEHALPILLQEALKNNVTFEKPIINGSRTVAIIDDYFKDSPVFDLDCPKIYIHSSEADKTLATVERIYTQLLELEADRDTFIVGIGGGITTDITGFVATTFKRGLRFGLIPTTLLAQVDAAVGGKNGVNFSRFKNMVGTFAQAEWIYVNPDYLSSLPERTLLCGVSEVLKVFILRDGQAYRRAVEFFCSDRSDRDAFAAIIRRAIEIKQEIVEQDPLDHGLRNLLNLGHTFGHAIEKNTHEVLHGEAVAIGIVMAANMAVEMGKLSSDDRDTILADWKRIGLPTACSIPEDELQSAILQDKKRTGKTIRFILPVKIGDAIIWEKSVTA